MTSSFTRFIFATIAVFLLSGAAVQAEQPNLRSIKRVAIDSEIPQPEIPFIQGPGNFKAFMIGGAIGTIFDEKSAGRAFREYMRQNNIDISVIVLNSFTRVIEEDKLFELGMSGDATLKLAVNTYGFGPSGFLGGSGRKPMLNVTASLVAGDGNVILKKTNFITNLSKLTTAYTYDQLAQDPQLSSKSFEQASVLVARLILLEFKK
jgi:hypothetical protein